MTIDLPKNSFAPSTPANEPLVEWKDLVYREKMGQRGKCGKIDLEQFIAMAHQSSGMSHLNFDDHHESIMLAMFEWATSCVPILGMTKLELTRFIWLPRNFNFIDCVITKADVSLSDILQDYANYQDNGQAQSALSIHHITIYGMGIRELF